MFSYNLSNNLVWNDSHTATTFWLLAHAITAKFLTYYIHYYIFFNLFINAWEVPVNSYFTQEEAEAFRELSNLSKVLLFVSDKVGIWTHFDTDSKLVSLLTPSFLFTPISQPLPSKYIQDLVTSYDFYHSLPNLSHHYLLPQLQH